MDQSATDMAKQVSHRARDFPRRQNGHSPKSEKVVLGNDLAIQVQRRQPSTSKELSRSCNCSLQRRSLRVLVVDNDQDTSDELGWWLHRGGHSPWVAYDGQVALCLAAKQHPHLVLMNVEMPQMDGCQVAQQLRLDFPKSECFIIGFTWRTDAERRNQAIEAGIDLLLTKPLELFLVETLILL